MFKYLILETLRGWKALLKNYAMVVAGMIFAIFISLSVLGDAFKLLSSFLTSNMLYTACLMIFIQTVLILHQKKPIIIIKPALFHSTFNSPKFRNVKMYMIVKKIVINIILAFIIGLILFGFNFSFHSMKIIFYLVAFFLVCSVIKWMKYNHFNIIITLMVFISACTLFLLSVLYDWVIIRFFFILLCLSSLLLINKVTVNWGKYFDDILYAEKVDSAGRHMNIAEMTQITNDNMAKGNNILNADK